MLRFACAWVIVSLAASAFQPQNGSTDSGREKDAYAIYSLMLTNPRTSHGSYDSEWLLIATTTKPPSAHLSCMRSSKDREAEFREVLADYESRRTTPRQLKPLFSIPKPYMLLTDDEVRAFTAERMTFSAQRDDRFGVVSDYFMLSDVYFHKSNSQGLTAASIASKAKGSVNRGGLPSAFTAVPAQRPPKSAAIKPLASCPERNHDRAEQLAVRK